MVPGKNSLTTVDLFTGAGGMCQGFKDEGFNCLYANDFEEPALETFRLNHPNTIAVTDSIENLDADKILSDLKLRVGELDVLVGGPPCQGFSTYGKRDSDDDRNKLYRHYLRFLKTFRPKSFVIENVMGILSMDGGAIVEDILSIVKKLGYSTNVSVLDAADFGVPQYRRRVFIYGAADKKEIKLPVQTHWEKCGGKKNRNKGAEQESLFEDFDPNRKAHITVKEAISDLPEIALPPKRTHETLPYPDVERITDYQKILRSKSKHLLHHSAKRMMGIRRLRMALMKPGEYGNNLRNRIVHEGLSQKLIDELLSGDSDLRSFDDCRMEDREKEMELRAILEKGSIQLEDLFSKIDSGGFANKYRRLDWDRPSHTLVAHMARDCSDFVHPEVDRFISVREAARLQSFPDNYVFSGSQFRQFRQIGNAVPPKLARAIAKSVKESILS